MVGSIASHLSFTSETSLSLYQKNFHLDRFTHPVSIPEPLLVPEILEERELSPEGEALGYNRRGKMNRGATKGLLIDTYR
jgi:hypothetical protein